MATLNSLDKKINHYLPRLTSRQKKTVLTVVKTFVEEDDEALWNDKEFVSMLDDRTKEYESGKIKTLSLKQLETGAKKAYQSKFSQNK
jgi:hypothetical protein